MLKNYPPPCSWLLLITCPACTILILLLGGAFFVRGQAVVVKDINTDPASIAPARFCHCGDNFYFAVQDHNGNELWKSDGTPQGTVIVKDINPGSGSGLLNTAFACLTGQLFFSGFSSQYGHEIWKTDGTDAGTLMLKDIAAGLVGSSPSGFIERDGSVYFLTTNPETLGLELWITDGTEPGTALLKALGNGYSFLQGEMKATGNGIYFITSRSGIEELWRSDGSPEGTVILKKSPWLYELEVAHDRIYFAESRDGMQTVWVSNGTPGDTTVVKEFSGVFPQRFFAFGTGLVFDTNNDTYFTDGTVGGTINLYSGNVYAAVVFQGRFYGVGGGFNSFLFSTDGTSAGTIVHGNLADNPDRIAMSGRIPVLNNTLLVGTMLGSEGHELSTYDPSNGKISLLKDMNTSGHSSPHNFIIFNNKVFFLADDGIHGSELWYTDGSTLGTALLKDIQSGTQSSNPGSGILTEMNGNLLFMASEVFPGPLNLWKSDGTESGTQLYHDFESYPIYMGRFGSQLLFYDNKKFLKTSGASGEISVFKDFTSQVGMPSSLGFSLSYNFNGKYIFYFSTSSSSSLNFGGEAWITDGTDVGTFLLKDIKPGSAGSMSNLSGAVLNEKFIFGADDGVNGSELWMTDGTTDGTTLLLDIRTGAGGSGATSFCAFNESVFFVADDGNNGVALWKTNGTASGTNIVKVLGSSGIRMPYSLTVAGNRIFFPVFSDSDGWTLWQSDGTTEGTQLIKDIHPGSSESELFLHLTAIGDRIYFSASDGTNGREVWISDGTAEGTYFIDLVPGIENSNPRWFTQIQGVVFISAGGKLWTTDGTAQNTAPAAENEVLGNVVLLDGWLYFQGMTIGHGMELLKLPFEDLTTGVEGDGVSQLEVYPNPAREAVRIMSNISTDASVTLTDMLGRVISSFKLAPRANSDLSVERFENGLYILRVVSSHGTEVMKLVKN